MVLSLEAREAAARVAGKAPPLTASQRSLIRQIFSGVVDGATLSPYTYVDMPTYLYRHFDSSGTLLYVGITNNPDNREKSHRKKSPWAAQISRIDLTGPFATRTEAEAAERVAIKDENPVHNQVRPHLKATDRSTGRRQS